MAPKVIQYSNLPEDLHNRLRQSCDVTQVDSLKASEVSNLAALLAEAEGLIGVNQLVGAELLDQTPNLKAASTISVGYDPFDVPELTKRGVQLMHTPGVLTETTADMVFTLILCAARRAQEVGDLIRLGGWTEKEISSDYFGSDVHGKKLGMLGLGRIGSAVARRGYAGFGMEILYHSRSPKEQAEKEFNARRCSLDEILSEADFVCAMLPLSEETHHLIGAAELAKMKPSAFLINGGRGPVVDEAALAEALQNGTIKGAGLDVFEEEPLPPDSPLMQLPNVAMLPHIGSATHETRYAMAKCAVDNLLAALESRSTVNCVNPEAVK
jgi:gluconate 2-dehydrogenase